MGFYINPKDMEKEEYLEIHTAGEVPLEDLEAVFETLDYLPLCLFDNGAFTALGIAYSREEIGYWVDSDANDSRPRTYHKMHKSFVNPFLPVSLRKA